MGSHHVSSLDIANPTYCIHEYAPKLTPVHLDDPEMMRRRTVPPQSVDDALSVDWSKVTGVALIP
jgi:hypothetical protein